jgi:hypothetical protein
MGREALDEAGGLARTFVAVVFIIVELNEPVRHSAISTVDKTMDPLYGLLEPFY